MAIKAFAAQGAGKRLEPFSYEPGPLGPFDIEITITHCGLCHSDIHLIDDDWQMSGYPLVPGHEIIGTVTAVGPEVNRFSKGERVGVGWQNGACLECESCKTGFEQLCAQHRPTCVAGYGGFAGAIRTDSRFAYAIPESLSSENAGPLLCAGITVYSPLRNHDVKPSQRVGVIGIGGLGHLAIQFAAARGCEVTAFSSTPDKEDEARKFGAHHFVASADPGALDKAAGSLDFIINTAFADLDWSAYLNTLRPNGTLCFVGAPPSPVSVSAFSLLMGHRSISGSIIGGRAAMEEMLQFAARHDIRTQTEALPMDRVNEAIDRVRANKARYRMVLTN